MSNQIPSDKINEWKKLVINNPEREQEQQEVLQKYGHFFNPDNIDHLTKDIFKSFLLFKNNNHWEGIHRQSNLITEDMNKLIKAFKVLLDESKDIKKRLNFLFPLNKPGYIKGLGRAIITPILMIVYPDKYGVYNSKSESSLKILKLLPKFKSKDSFADRYVKINQILNDLASQYSVNLWQLDWLLGWIDLGRPIIQSKDQIELMETSSDKTLQERYGDFELESHLEDFLIENWDKLDIGKKYQILEKDGDIIGQQYSTSPAGVGIIDILAKSKDNKEWLVVELKKGRSGDQVVGQILRYMGWLRKNKAQADEKIKGLIIVGEVDDKIKYSLSSLSDISLMTYGVSFKLDKVDI